MLCDAKESTVIFLFSLCMEDFKARYRAQVDKVTGAAFISKNGSLPLSTKTANLELTCLLGFSREMSFAEAIPWQYGSRRVRPTLL